MPETKTYRWQVPSRLKTDLEDAARERQKSLAELLEEIAEEWLMEPSDAVYREQRRQQQLRNEAMRFAGSIEGNDPERASEVRERVRERLARKHGR